MKCPTCNRNGLRRNDAQISVRCPHEMRRDLNLAASHAGVSLNQLCIDALQAELNKFEEMIGSHVDRV